MEKIALIYRKHNGGYSIEGLFLPLEKLDYVDRFELPCELKGIKSFFKILIFLLSIKHKTIHITGDVNYVAFLLFWKKTILTVHDFNYFESLQGFKRKVYKLIWITLPVKCANKIVCISPFSSTQLLKIVNINKKKLLIIPNFFYPFTFNSSAKLVNKNFTILSIGTAFNKNLFRLIEAVKGLNNVTLVLIGKQKKAFMDKLHSSNIPFVCKYNLTNTELGVEYNKASMLFYASTSEGFGLPILEAQSAGLVVLTSNTTSMPYVAGEGAVLVNPLDVDEIRNAILKIKDDLVFTNNLRNKGFENVKRFSKKAYLKSYIQLYQETKF